LSTTVRLFRDISIHDTVGRESFFDPSPSLEMTLLTKQDHGNLRRTVLPKKPCPRARSAMALSTTVSTIPASYHCAVNYDRTTGQTRGGTAYIPQSPDKFYDVDLPFSLKPLMKFPKAERFPSRPPEATDSRPSTELSPSRIKEAEAQAAKNWDCHMVPFGKLVPRNKRPQSVKARNSAAREDPLNPSQTTPAVTDSRESIAELRAEKQEQMRKAAAFAKLGYRKITGTNKDEKAKRRALRGLDFGVSTSRKAMMWHVVQKEDLTHKLNFHTKKLERGKAVTISNHNACSRPDSSGPEMRPALRKLLSGGQLHCKTDMMAIPIGCNTRKYGGQIDHTLMLGRSVSVKDLIADVKISHERIPSVENDLDATKGSVV